jgi:mitochondrial fission protein ELM1
METTRLLVLPEAPVWVLEDPAGSGPAAAIAGRLGVPFRRIGPAGPEGRVAAGSLPELVISSGLRSGARALLLRARHGCRVVHCASTARFPIRLSVQPFDMMVLPSDTVAFGENSRLMPVLGTPHVVSPALLARARLLWAERLEHLPTPRIVILLGGGAPSLREAVELARRLAAMAQLRGGCVLATALPDCRPAVADAFAAGLSACLHLFHRAGEPGDDPVLGFLGNADVVIAAWTGAQTLSEACAVSAPVFMVPAKQKRGAERARGLAERLMALDHVRLLQDSLSPWPRTPLDEAGRIARTILGRFVVLET